MVMSQLENFDLRVTDSVAAGVRSMVERHKLPADTAGLRVGAYKGGCSGYMYDVRVAGKPQSGDAVTEINGVRVFVDRETAHLINGMQVDWVSTMQESRFVFNNPNATGECGCGVSFTVDE